MKARERWKTKIEECRQALAVHGGPLNFCAASLGVRLSRVRIPSRRLRCLIYRRMYGKKYPPLDETELERALGSYPSLNALFTRSIRSELRPIAEGANKLLAPCDGSVQEIGRLRDGKIMTVKGIEYTAGSLVANGDASEFRDGHYAIIFLSPLDCHRVFSPQDVACERVVHVPGYRLVVHPPFQRREFPTFTYNERVILRLSTPLGACALVLVAGWGVGNISLRFDPDFKVRARFGRRARVLSEKTYAPPVPVRKGNWLATFELGSTAILMFERGAGVKAEAATGSTVRYGQPLFTCSA
jgi:phosphatidylserine decarboxylase